MFCLDHLIVFGNAWKQRTNIDIDPNPDLDPDPDPDPDPDFYLTLT